MSNGAKCQTARNARPRECQTARNAKRRKLGRRTEETAVVIPSEAPKARSRGIALVPKERPLYRDDCDSSLGSE
jgi:hypothetical protein